MAADQWIAYQFHLPDVNQGIVLAFRHEKAPANSLKVRLHGLDPRIEYSVELIDEDRRSVMRSMGGAELAALQLEIPRPRASLLVRYHRK